MLSILLSCVTFLWTPAARAADAPALPADHLRLPNVRQTTDYSCGAASLESVLSYWGVYDGGEATLIRELGTNSDDGTKASEMVEAAERRGLEAKAIEGMTFDDLRAALKRGDTVILDIQAWADWDTGKPPLRGAQWAARWEDGHYVVLIAMDGKNAFFMDPSTLPGYAYIPLDELAYRWHDYDRIGREVRRYKDLGIDIRGKAPASPPVLSRMD